MLFVCTFHLKVNGINFSTNYINVQSTLGREENNLFRLSW